MKKTAESNLLNEEGTNYDKDAYPKAANTVDICICRVHQKKLQLLVVKRKHPPFRGMWVIPGGFVDIDKNETLEESANRELEEETHATGIPIRQLGSYGDPERDPRDRIITTVFYAFLSDEKMKNQELEADDDADEYKWLDIGGKKIEKLGFDHNKIVKDLLGKIRKEIITTPIAFEFVNKFFTWEELRNVYKTILGHELSAPNFRRKIDDIYDVKETNKSVPIARGRFPKLLQFKGTRKVF